MFDNAEVLFWFRAAPNSATGDTSLSLEAPPPKFGAGDVPRSYCGAASILFGVSATYVSFIAGVAAREGV